MYPSVSDTGHGPPPLTVPRKPLPEKNYVTESKLSCGSWTSNRTGPGWRPFYLRRRIIGTYVATYLVALIAIALIYYFSMINMGWTMSTDAKRYLCKYAPTAVVVVISAFWGRTIYQVKAIAPWTHLRRGASSAERSILLDYISDIEPVALYRSIYVKDFLIAACIGCGLLLKVAVVLSTAMISSQRVLLEYEDTNFISTNVFLNDSAKLDQVGSMPYHTLLANTDGVSPYPDGTNNRFAFQTIDAPNLPYGSQIEAEVDAFSADLDCIPANLTVKSWLIPIVGIYGVLSFNSADCLVALKAENMMNDYSTGGSYLRWAQMRNLHCTNQTGLGSNRTLITTGEARSASRNGTIVPDPNKPSTNITALQLHVTSSTNYLCKPKYQILKLAVSTNRSSSVAYKNWTLSESKVTHSYQLASVNAENIMKAFYDSFDRISYDKYSVLPNLRCTEPDSISCSLNLPVRFGLYSLPAAQQSYDYLFNGTALQAFAKNMYTRYAAQIARAGLMKEQNSTVLGSALIIERRLLAQTVPIYVTGILLGVLMVLTIGIFFMVPKEPLVPWNAFTIAGLAPIVQASPDLVGLLRETSSLGRHYLHTTVNQAQYRSLMEAAPDTTKIKIEVLDNGPAEFNTSKPGMAMFRWWQPVPCKVYFRIPVFIIVLLIIIALEVLLQWSEKHQGFGAVFDMHIVPYVWNYIPASAMILTSMYFSSLDVSIRTITPYRKLREGCSWFRGMATDFVDMTSVVVIPKALRAGYYAVVLSTLAGFLGNFLTIFIAGLYSMENAPSNQTSTLQVTDWLRYADAISQSTSDGPAFSTATLILQANLSYPQWTYDTLVFPKLNLPQAAWNSSSTTSDSNLRIVARTPAFRSNYQCRFFNPNTWSLTLGNGTFTANPGPKVSIWVPEEYCPRSRARIVVTPVSVSARFGDYFAANYAGTTGYCSSYYFIWGLMNNTGVKNVMGVACNETYEVVDVDTNFVSTSFAIDENSPPKVVESSAKRVTLDYTYGATIAKEFADLYADDYLDGFFSAVVYGRYRTPIEYLGNNNKRDDVLSGIKHQMQVMKAQAISNHLRVPLINATNVTTTTIEATISDPTHQSLTQNVYSTRIVQALLLAMLCLAAIPAMLLDTRKLLPFSPTSIAAQASLLADSNLLDPQVVPEGVEGVKTREEHRVSTKNSNLSTTFVRLGWFQKEMTRRRARSSTTTGTTMMTDEVELVGEGVEENGYQRVFTINTVDVSNTMRKRKWFGKTYDAVEG